MPSQHSKGGVEVFGVYGIVKVAYNAAGKAGPPEDTADQRAEGISGGPVGADADNGQRRLLAQVASDLDYGKSDSGGRIRRRGVNVRSRLKLPLVQEYAHLSQR